ncbi:unnamed protein product [Moneuplotes crassus]|uniref:Uncharacterized protein n=1 Tax=Euplotes crassus TaxID=5936 RepID=A0AAD1XGY0_EUPCR|nr:unnamed protein product [Moneuplotes crassus]
MFSFLASSSIIQRAFRPIIFPAVRVRTEFILIDFLGSSPIMFLS